MDIRDARDDDSEAMLALMGACFAEYPNCYLVLDELPEMRAPATSFASWHGRLWAVEEGAELIGMIGCAPSHEPGEHGSWELKKLNVAKRARGRGLGKRLIALVEDEARRAGATRIHLWSDTRFETAHLVYARAGYTKLPETRDLHDASDTIEFHFEK